MQVFKSLSTKVLQLIRLAKFGTLEEFEALFATHDEHGGSEGDTDKKV